MIFVGTSGWQYDSWRTRFYPQDLPKSAWLYFFSEHFPTVEVNNSFYRLPSEDAVDRWRRESADPFLVALKAGRFLTHVKRLRDPAESVALFWSRAVKLGPKLGPVLFQLPPRFPADLPRLETFLDALPDGIVPAVEFRDPSWHRDDVFDALDRHGAALVWPDRPRLRAPREITGGWLYVRFHQGRIAHPGYPRAKLHRWADLIAAHADKQAYVYFNNDPLGAAVRDAVTFHELLAERGCELAEPRHSSAA